MSITKPDHEYDGCRECWKWHYLRRGVRMLPRPKDNKEVLKTWGLIAEAKRERVHPLDLEFLNQRTRRALSDRGGSK